MLVTEIGLLKILDCENINSCVEAYDFNHKMYIIVHLMKNNITETLDPDTAKYPE